MSKEEIKFDADSFESIIDLAHVGDVVASRIFNQLVAFVDERSIKDETTLELEITKAKENWLRARNQQTLPNNSTFRSALSTVRGAVREGVSLFTGDGEAIGKSALSKLIATAKENLSDGEVTEKALDRRMSDITTRFANLLSDASPAKQVEFVTAMYDSMVATRTKLGIDKE